MDLSVALGLLGVVGLVLANAFFVAAEFALVTARKTRIRELAEGGDRLARSVEKTLGNLDRAISGTQLGITLASLGLGWIGEPAVAQTLERLMTAMSVQLSPVALHTVAIVIAFGFITYLHIVLGELAPKTVALLRPEAVSRLVAPPLNLFNRLVAPGIWLLNGSANLFLRMLGLREPTAAERVHSPEEIEMLVHQSLRQGVVEEDEQAMIQGVFELTHTVAREVMTPRPDIVGASADATIEDLLKMAADSGFSRLPVYEGSIDDIVGVVVVKDLLPWIVDRSRDSVSAREVMRDALFVPDTKAVDDLLAELRSQKLHMAIVVDEFGGTDGIVTLEDLVEEIVGEIYDEHDVAQADVAVEPDGRIVIDGGYSFSDLLAKFDLPAAEEEYDTVAGYVIGMIGRIPEVGESVPIGEAELEVLELNERRITRLELKGVTGASSTGVAEEVP
jgi:CBS domain containing-hemolysin-like protein